MAGGTLQLLWKCRAGRQHRQRCGSTGTGSSGVLGRQRKFCGLYVCSESKQSATGACRRFQVASVEKHLFGQVDGRARAGAARHAEVRGV